MDSLPMISILVLVFTLIFLGEHMRLKKEVVDKVKKINNIDGFLIGGASQSSKKFIDIIKKTFN